LSDSYLIRWARPTDLEVPVVSRGVPHAVLQTRFAARGIAVAEHASRAIGALQLEYLWGTRPYIALIRVQPEHQRRGAGRALLAFVENALRHDGHDALLSSSQEDEAESQAWHRHMGFVDCGILAGINEGGVGEIFFRKRLSAG
jgi:GNAT superfamily N-acetyltransferase